MIYRTIKQLIQKTLLLALTIYSDYLSYFLPSSCRFYPSCSHYSYEAIKEHGSLRGAYITLGRLFRCHPWHEGGFDPVPKRRPNNKAAAHSYLCCNKHEPLKTNAATNT